MKAGCSGCLGGLVLLGVAALVIGGILGAGTRMLAAPGDALPATTAADGTRAQQKIFDLVRRPREGPVTLSEAEINALLTRHLVEARGVRLSKLGARLVGDDRVQLFGQLPARQLLDEAGLGAVSTVLPAGWVERPLWVNVGARVSVESGRGRQLRLDVEDFALGRQRLPSRLLRLVLDPAAIGLLRWPLPEHVERVSVEPGRVVIRSASSR
jgi:hypothetical protein